MVSRSFHRVNLLCILTDMVLSLTKIDVLQLILDTEFFKSQ